MITQKSRGYLHWRSINPFSGPEARDKTKVQLLKIDFKSKQDPRNAQSTAEYALQKAA